MDYKILVVDDEPQIQTFMRISLVAEGFIYVGADTLSKAAALLDSVQPHLVVLDLGLPDGDGSDFLVLIRQSRKTPVLILTARDQEDEKIRLLEAGANDYLSKPFGIRELIVRVKVLLRDLVIDEPFHDVVLYGSLKLQKSTHQCWLLGNEVMLTKKEFSFVEKLMLTPGKLVKQTDLLRDIWGETHINDTHYLRVLISQLRKKLNDSADDQHIIKTESGVGYRLVPNKFLSKRY
ncbi:response regulator [Vibrio vulnificus]|uniref:response regulator n=1 Tax=Vibrio vulnificus TaxID=672 RepID=UPI00050165BA|nr:response regulator transcription factor [Vibrio vulnificus]EGR1511214.1 response regulator transcription factor [Vibrio vulnificus]EIE1223886.1 response regulator transcription factor [Vibrio vulnificus]EJS4044276.1 response regulator transcription factor [Vibrio vulnificus]EKZ9176859.1 response regulator transcription factor [Vibrio vulnificus]KFK56768.1 transcriptional regulator [Vibrio vulnificus]